MDVVGLASFVPRFLSYISSIPKMGDMALGKRLRGYIELKENPVSFNSSSSSFFDCLSSSW